MSTPPPIKPPRGVKYSKETSGCGLLVSVIKTLDASETNEQREKEKQKIEKEYRKSDQKLNELVSKHDGDLTKVMQLFSKVSTQITNSREKIHSVKENLHACKHLLHCRRDELKKLWMDAVQQKYVLELLEQINELRKVPTLVTNYMLKKHYLHATKSLTTAIALGDGPLRDVEGLNDLRQDLNSRRNQLYIKLLEEINKHLYQQSTLDVITTIPLKQGSGRFNNSFSSPFQRNVLRRSAERAEANTRVKKALFEMSQGFDIDKTEIIDDVELLDPDLNSTYFIGIIIECFALLNKVPESLEYIKIQIQNELLKIVTKTTQNLLTYNEQQQQLQQQQQQNQPQQAPILELLNLIFKQFKLIADAHRLILKNYLSVVQRYNLSVRLYDLTDFWTQAQAVLQLVLTDYLDIQNLAGEEEPRTNFAEQNSNINTYFSRRKIQNKKTLFKFDNSSHIIAEMDLQQKEHRRNPSDMSQDENLLLQKDATNPLISGIIKKREKILICQPDPSLVRLIYLPMLNYINEIENFIKCKPGQPSSLSAFLSNHIKETFLARGHNRNLQVTIESLSKNHDAWRAIITPEEMKQLGLNRPLLQSTVLVENRITETKNLIKDLPYYSEDLLKMVCSLLKTYRETCQAAYRGIVQPETEDKRIYSVTWLKDDDISRFLKTLPNWTDLKTSHQRAKVQQLTSMKQRQIGTLKQQHGIYPEPSEEESPIQVQQRNIREAEMLTSNLGEGGISQQEILSDIGVLKELAILQESMEWFSNRISEFANDLRKPIMNGLSTASVLPNNNELAQPIIVKDGTIKVLTNLALEFDELANTCLLVLHLEVRVQCFHYLRSNPMDKLKENNLIKTDVLEPDAKVLKLTKVLTDMDEALSSTLHPRKTKYVFEGLAHLAARILIIAANYMENIDQYGVQKMCRNALALQQTLSSITASREIALDHVKNFYEMFYMDPDDFLTNIIEKGAQFSEMQYLNALQLICKSRNINDQNLLANYQQKLSDILGTKPAIGITV